MSAADQKAEVWATIARLRALIQQGVNVQRNERILAGLEELLDEEESGAEPGSDGPGSEGRCA